MNKAIIGGTGVYGMDGETTTRMVSTRFGDVEVDVVRIDEEDVVFLARHGKGHTAPPHLVNYRANMMALKELGIQYVYATAAVGSCNEQFEPGDIVVFKNFIDFTRQRPITFYEGKEGVIHADMSDPYCSDMRRWLMDAAKRRGLKVKGEAVYVCTEGPRFETSVEIEMFRILRGDVVGMTNIPEVVLAKELGMCYAAVGIITNWCTGMETEPVTLSEIQGALALNKERITETFLDVFGHLPDETRCACRDALIRL